MASKKAKGTHAKTRNLRGRGSASKVSVNTLLRQIPIGQSVQVTVDSSIHSGQPFRRFQGKTGIVSGKRGTCYIVQVYQGNQACEVVLNPAHLTIIRSVPRGADAKAEPTTKVVGVSA